MENPTDSPINHNILVTAVLRNVVKPFEIPLSIGASIKRHKIIVSEGRGVSKVTERLNYAIVENERRTPSY